MARFGFEKRKRGLGIFWFDITFILASLPVIPVLLLGKINYTKVEGYTGETKLWKILLNQS